MSKEPETETKVETDWPEYAGVPVHPFEPPFGEVGDGPDELQALGKIGEMVPQGMYLELLGLMHRLKARREAQGLSLSDVSARSGLTRKVLSELESGQEVNPSLATVYRYGLALDAGLTLGIEEVEPV